jgi:uncharacterized membrane protein
VTHWQFFIVHLLILGPLAFYAGAWFARHEQDSWEYMKHLVIGTALMLVLWLSMAFGVRLAFQWSEGQTPSRNPTNWIHTGEIVIRTTNQP